METITYYSEPHEGYACREIVEDDFVKDIFGKFYGESEHKRNNKPLMSKLDINTITQGDKITKEEYEAL